MIIDSSALLAILLGEPDAGRYATAIAQDPDRLLSALFYLETAPLPILFKGDDFSRTDAERVELPPG